MQKGCCCAISVYCSHCFSDVLTQIWTVEGIQDVFWSRRAWSTKYARLCWALTALTCSVHSRVRSSPTNGPHSTAVKISPGSLGDMCTWTCPKLASWSSRWIPCQLSQLMTIWFVPVLEIIFNSSSAVIPHGQSPRTCCRCVPSEHVSSLVTYAATTLTLVTLTSCLDSHHSISPISTSRVFLRQHEAWDRHCGSVG